MKNKYPFSKFILFTYLGITTLIVIMGVITFVQVKTIYNDTILVTKEQGQLLKAEKMVWSDEVLTSCIKNYIYTKEQKILDRYFEVADALDVILKDAKENSTSNEVQDIFKRVDKENLVLIDAENLIIELVKQDEKEKALEILNGTNYQESKKNFSNALSDFLENSSDGAEAVGKKATDNINLLQSFSTLMLVLFIIIGTIITGIGFYVFNKIHKFAKYLILKHEEVKSGNLLISLDAPNNEFGLIIKSLGELLTTMIKIVSNIVSGSESILGASKQLNDSSLQLSHGANEQATSVEEVSSTMEQISASVQQNADNAKETEQIAYVFNPANVTT